VTVIHDVLLTAVQAQPLGAETVTVSVPPVDVKVCDVGETVSLQVTPAWVTVKVTPPIVSVPVRFVPAVLAAAVKLTVPFPDPDAPAVIVNQLSLLVAVHEQPVGAVTDVEPVPPAAAIDSDVGESE
jgi:hypothetical protein